MFDSDNWQEIFSALKKNKLRTFFTAFGVFWGIFMLVIMLGSGKGLQNGTLEGFSGFATNSFFMWAQKTSKPYMGLPVGRFFNFKNEDVQAIKDNVPEAEIVAPSNQLNGYNGANQVVRGVKNGVFTVRGDVPDIFKMESLKLLNGRYINNNDITEKRKVCMIGDRVKEVLFNKDENPINEYVRVNGIYFRIIGFFKPTKSGGEGVERSETIYIPYSTFQQAFNYGNRVGWFAITSKPNVPASVVEEKVKDILKKRHKIAPEDMMAIGSWNMEVQFKKMTGLFSGIDMLIWIVGTGTLLAGVIGVSNIMLIIVKERTKEIGIKRALGATPIQVVSQILLESVFLTSLAGYFGLIAGVFLLESVSKAIGEGAEDSMFKNPEVDLNIALLSLIVLVISGLLAGFIPAKRAISIAPVDALRTD